MESLGDLFTGMQVSRVAGVARTNKPLLVLAALARNSRGENRLATLPCYEAELARVFETFGRVNMLFPFGRLCGDGFWEIPKLDTLKKNSAGDLIRSELIERQIVAGFSIPVFQALSKSKEATADILRLLLSHYFAEADRDLLLSTLNIAEAVAVKLQAYRDHRSDGHRRYGGVAMASTQCTLRSTRKESEFIGYLNSLHSLGADGSNSLAESQAMSRFFGELYEPFSIVEPLKRLLSEEEDRVVILTGHAGDGKSTIALDVYKALQGLPPSQPLPAPLGERVPVPTASGSVTIVKDMSELSSDERKGWLHQAFDETGSWLIVSNTGPLLNSMLDYAEDHALPDMESRILNQLDQPVREAALADATLAGFRKPLLILNLTRLDNVALGARLLGRLVQHSGWRQCHGCDVQPVCPLALNRRALLESIDVAEERVRWLYRRINDYEQRLTLRQIVAHLAYGLTGGMGCTEARSAVESATGTASTRATAGLRKILFSERFFGCGDGRPDPDADALKAIRLLRRADIGGPVAADIERGLVERPGGGWAHLPKALSHLTAHWAARAAESQGWPARAALRRQVFIYGVGASASFEQFQAFFDVVLRSPEVRKLDDWKRTAGKTLTRNQQKRLRVDCLSVLLEQFSGFSAEQFQQSADTLFFGMRRPDRATMQPAQLVSASIPFRDFDIRFDESAEIPILQHKPSSIQLQLALPLLDFIRRKREGEIGHSLTPMHQIQLDKFRANLLGSHVGDEDEGDIAFLRAGVSGEVDVVRYFLNRTTKQLERD